MAFGTSKLLCFPEFEQVIVNVNVKAGTFTFIDRADLQLGKSEPLANLARLQILSGAVYNVHELRGDRTQQTLFAQLELACDPMTKPEQKKEILKPPIEKQPYFLQLKSVIQEAAVAINKERQITCISKKGDASLDQKIYGKFCSSHTHQSSSVVRSSALALRLLLHVAGTA